MIWQLTHKLVVEFARYHTGRRGWVRDSHKGSLPLEAIWLSSMLFLIWIENFSFQFLS